MTQQTIVFTFDNANSNTTVTQSFDMESINYLEDGSTTVGILHQYPTVKNVSETQYLITSQLDGFCMLAWFPPKRSSMTDSSFKEVTSVQYILIILAYLIFTKKVFQMYNWYFKYYRWSTLLSSDSIKVVSKHNLALAT